MLLLNLFQVLVVVVLVKMNNDFGATDYRPHPLEGEGVVVGGHLPLRRRSRASRRARGADAKAPPMVPHSSEVPTAEPKRPRTRPRLEDSSQLKTPDLRGSEGGGEGGS